MSSNKNIQIVLSNIKIQHINRVDCPAGSKPTGRASHTTVRTVLPCWRGFVIRAKKDLKFLKYKAQVAELRQRDRQGEEAIPQPVLSMEIRICIIELLKRVDLYNKSRVMGD
jgi:hypothetical protein